MRRANPLLGLLALLAACPLPNETPYELLPQAARVATCQLSGTPNAGETWTVRRGGSDCAHVVAPTQSLPDVAQGLALALDALDGLTAGAEGSLIACVDIAGGAPDIVLSVSSPATATVYETTALTKLVLLAGSPAEGTTWSIQIDDGVSQGYDYTVASGDALEQVAAGLANAIDRPGYVAGAEGTTVAVIRVGGEEFELTATAPAGGSADVEETTATTKTLVLSGPYFPEDTWGVQLAGSETVYTVSSGDTGADVAAAEGPVLTVTRLAGGELSLDLAVDPR